MHFTTLIIGLVAWAATPFTAHAETWPPLKPPDPLPIDWVVKQVFVRFPETHAKHRAYLSALERVPRGAETDLRVQVARDDAELVRLQAVEHHLMLQWQASHAFYDYAFAEKSLVLLENFKRLVDAYLPAFRARMGRRPGARDLAVDATRLHSDLLRLQQQRLDASLKLNMLMEHRLEANLPPAKLGEIGALPADRDALINRTIANGPAMRMAQIEVKRSGVNMELLKTPAATHEAARAQDQQRATGARTVANVISLYAQARTKRDMLTLHTQEILPRIVQQQTAALAEYQGGRLEIFELLDAYRAQYLAEVEALQLRTDYEKLLADLTREAGTLPAYMEQKMSLKPLNVGKDKQ